MAISVKIPTQLRSATDGETTALVDGETVGEVLDALYERYGELRSRIAEDGGFAGSSTCTWAARTFASSMVSRPKSPTEMRSRSFRRWRGAEDPPREPSRFVTPLRRVRVELGAGSEVERPRSHGSRGLDLLAHGASEHRGASLQAEAVLRAAKIADEHDVFPDGPGRAGEASMWYLGWTPRPARGWWR